jgi:hypothetical protein
MHIKLQFKVERSLGDPLIRIMIDDTIATYNGPCQDVFEFDLPVTVGEHELRITHYGKKDQDHVYDDQGNITVDKHVEISGIWLDEIELVEELWEGNFFPVYNPDYIKDLKNKGIDVPYSIKPNLYLGHNGTWQLIFNYPIASWLIEKRSNRTKVSGADWQSSDEALLIEVKEYFSTAPELNWNIKKEI